MRRGWGVLAAATLWAVEVGGAGEPPDLPRVPRASGVLKTGLLILLPALLRGEPLPQGQSEHHAWPARTWQPAPLTQESPDQC